MNTKSSISTSGEATTENTTFGFVSETKNDLALIKLTSLFLCFKFAIIRIIPVRQPACQIHSIFLAILRQILVFPAGLLGMIFC